MSEITNIIIILENNNIINIIILSENNNVLFSDSNQN